MKNKTIYVKDGNIDNTLKELKELGYNYIIKASDRFLSGWGYTNNKKHIQLIACKTIKERETILNDLYSDNSFNYINWYSIDDIKQIKAITRGKSYTIRNDWTKCF